MNAKRIIFLSLCLPMISAPVGVQRASAKSGDATACIEQYRALARLLDKKSGPLHVRTPDWSRISVKEGKAVEPDAFKNIDEFDERLDWNFIGSGTQGASVYRARQSTGQSHVLKQYSSAIKRNSDQRALDFLRSIANGFEVATVEIADSKTVGPRSMQLDDVRGKSLSQVLFENEASDFAKELLISRWNQFVKEIADRHGTAASTSLVLENDRTLRLFLRLWEDERYDGVHIYLKPDNVIVESGTGRLVLIDPY